MESAPSRIGVVLGDGKARQRRLGVSRNARAEALAVAEHGTSALHQHIHTEISSSSALGFHQGLGLNPIAVVEGGAAALCP